MTQSGFRELFAVTVLRVRLGYYTTVLQFYDFFSTNLVLETSYRNDSSAPVSSVGIPEHLSNHSAPAYR